MAKETHEFLVDGYSISYYMRSDFKCYVAISPVCSCEEWIIKTAWKGDDKTLIISDSKKVNWVRLVRILDKALSSEDDVIPERTQHEKDCVQDLCDIKEHAYAMSLPMVTHQVSSLCGRLNQYYRQLTEEGAGKHAKDLIADVHNFLEALKDDTLPF